MPSQPRRRRGPSWRRSYGKQGLIRTGNFGHSPLGANASFEVASESTAPAWLGRARPKQALARPGHQPDRRRFGPWQSVHRTEQPRRNRPGQPLPQPRTTCAYESFRFSRSLDDISGHGIYPLAHKKTRRGAGGFRLSANVRRLCPAGPDDRSTRSRANEYHRTPPPGVRALRCSRIPGGLFRLTIRRQTLGKRMV